MDKEKASGLLGFITHTHTHTHTHYKRDLTTRRGKHTYTHTHTQTHTHTHTHEHRFDNETCGCEVSFVKKGNTNTPAFIRGRKC